MFSSTKTLNEELELNKMDNHILQVTRMSHAVAEVNESCLGKILKSYGVSLHASTLSIIYLTNIRAAAIMSVFIIIIITFSFSLYTDSYNEFIQSKKSIFVW